MGAIHSKRNIEQVDSPAKEEPAPKQSKKGEPQEQEAVQDNCYSITIEDERIKKGSALIEYEGPLTPQQLEQDAGRPNQLFLVRFPNESDQMAYLDTAFRTLSFQEMPSSPNLSILMNLTAVRGTRSRDIKYRWSNIVIPESYLSVTKASLLGGQVLTFNNYPDPQDIPLWSVQASPPNNTMLGFVAPDDDGTQWYLMPIQANVMKTVVGVTDQSSAITVYHVTSHTSESIPLEDIIFPSEEGGDNLSRSRQANL